MTYPTLTYLGGSGNGVLDYSAIRDVAVDAEGNVYAAGGISLDGYGTGGAAQVDYAGGDADAFVASFSPDGELRFLTYLGGSAHDRAYGVEVTPAGIYIAGRAGAGFPTTAGSFQPSFAAGGGGEYGTQDGFVAKLSLDGSTWEWVSYLGGNGPEFCRDLDVDSQGQVWCAMIGVSFGIGLLDNAPGGFQGSYGGGSRDAALLQLSADGSQLLYGTYIGGSADEVGAASVRVASDDSVYYVVSTLSDNAPVTAGAYQTSRGGASDVLVLHIASDGQLLWGSYYGGSGDEGGETHNLALTDDDEPVVAMFTSSSNLPGTQNAALDGASGFVAVLGSGGGSLQAARYVGGSAVDEVEGVDARDGRIVVTGGTQSADFPELMPDFPGSGGDTDAFVTVYADGLGEPTYSTRISGQYYDWTHGVALGPNGQVAFVGSTRSLDLPVTSNALHAAPDPAIPVAGGQQIANGHDAGFVGWVQAP